MLPPPLIDIARIEIVMSTRPMANNNKVWTYSKLGSFSINERGIRIRPERTNQRRQIHKLTWKDGGNNNHDINDDLIDLNHKHNENHHQHRWMDTSGIKTLNSKMGFEHQNMIVKSPRLALRRLLTLFEKCQFREAANLINRLDRVTLQTILIDLPVDLFIEAMPKTLPLFEALYMTKAFDLSDFAVKQLLQPEALVMQMVKYFAKQDTDIHASVRSMSCNLGPSCNSSSCQKILHVIAVTEPNVRLLLNTRRRSLNKAIEGLGQHGLVGTSDETLMNLHDALRLEFEKVIQSYKIALQKLDEFGSPQFSGSSKFGTITSRSVYHGPAPINASHQRQLSLKQNEIQERLIKNKSLLNVIEPIVDNRSLNGFVNILKRRVEHDKDVLFQFTQLKREAKDVNPDSIVAPVLMRFSHGCDVVLHMLNDSAGDVGRQVKNGDDQNNGSSDDISGYHSDSDSVGHHQHNSTSGQNSANNGVPRNLFYLSARSTSRTSGRRSPSVSNTAPVVVNSNNSDNHFQDNKSDTIRSRGKYKKSDHVLGGSGNSGPNGSLPKGGSCPNCSAEGLSSPVYETDLKKEVEALRCDLSKARQTIVTLQDREHILKERLSEQAHKINERGCSSKVTTSGHGSTTCAVVGHTDIGEKRSTAVLVRRYGNLYAQARVETLDALDSMPELHDAEELKSKLLFSVIVLAFRSVHSSTRSMRESLRRLLQMPPEAVKDQIAAELDSSVAVYLRKTVDRFDNKKNVEEVCMQIWATLYDYPCLKRCDSLIQYIRDCVKLAWALVNQTPPYIVEYETRQFRRDIHVRFHSSNPNSEDIKTYLWPALLESEKGPCVHKAVVIT